MVESEREEERKKEKLHFLKVQNLYYMKEKWLQYCYIRWYINFDFLFSYNVKFYNLTILLISVTSYCVFTQSKRIFRWAHLQTDPSIRIYSKYWFGRIEADDFIHYGTLKRLTIIINNSKGSNNNSNIE